MKKHYDPGSLEVAMEAQAALATRNHELITRIDHLHSEMDRLRNELEMRPPPCDLLEMRTRAEKAELEVNRLRKRLARFKVQPTLAAKRQTKR